MNDILVSENPLVSTYINSSSENPTVIETPVTTTVTGVNVTTSQIVGTETQTIIENDLHQIVVNTKQSADCLTTIVAFITVFLIFLLGKWLYGIFKSILF